MTNHTDHTGEAMTADTSPCSPEDFWSDEGTESAPLASSDPDPAPETARTPTVPAAAQDGRTTDRFDVADLRSCIDRLSKRALAAEAERDALDATVRRLGSQNILMHLAIDNPESDESLLDQVKTLVAELDRHKRVVGTLNEMVERRDNRLAELEATIRRVEAVAADPDFANGHVSVVRIRAALAVPEPAQVQQADEAGA